MNSKAILLATAVFSAAISASAFADSFYFRSKGSPVSSVPEDSGNGGEETPPEDAVTAAIGFVANKVRAGTTLSGTLDTSLTNPSWIFSQTPAEPAIASPPSKAVSHRPNKSPRWLNKSNFPPMMTSRSDSPAVASADKHVMLIRETGEDGKAGHELQFTDIDFDPLDYECLSSAKLDQPVTIPLSGRGTIIGGNIPDAKIGTTYRFQTELQSRFASKSIGLVKGGWLPSAIALRDNSIVLPDRCVVAELDRRLKDGLTKSGGCRDFIDLFADHAIRINPALFALEGDEMKQPTAEAAQRSLEEAVRKLRLALPKAVLVAADAGGLRGVLGLIEDTRSGMDRKQDFLIRLNPKLQSPVARRRVQEVYDEVIATARACGLPARSLVVLAALSSAVVANGKSPAKGLLKLKAGYREQDAYNALADLRSLEVLMHIFAIWPDQRVMLCTADKDMALFWTGLRASNFMYQAGRMSFDVDPAALLPGISSQQWAAFVAQ